MTKIVDQVGSLNAGLRLDLDRPSGWDGVIIAVSITPNGLFIDKPIVTGHVTG